MRRCIVRDHARPVFHEALGVDPTEYDYKVFGICNQISRQVFPVELDIDEPRFRARMERVAGRRPAYRGRQGAGRPHRRALKRAGGMAGAGLAFASLYFQPTKPNALPETIRLQPAW